MSSFLTNFIITTVKPSGFIFSPPWFWLFLAFTLSGIELIVPKVLGINLKRYPLMMGICALIVSLILFRASATLGFFWHDIMYDRFDIQVMYWMGLCFPFLVWVRPIFVKRKKVTISETVEATTVTDILPNSKGKVLYEGCFWSAKCVDSSEKILAGEKVYVLRREGNTLMVASDQFFHP